MVTDDTHETCSARTAGWLVIIAIVLGLGIRLRFFGGLASIDDFNYLRHAAEVWQHRFDLAHVSYWHGMRPLLFVPISWSFAAFGVSEASATLWPLVASLLTIFLIFRIGARLGGRDVGVAGAFLAAIFPMAVEESTRVLPGPFINLLIAGSTYFFLKGEDASRGRGIHLALSGILLASMPWVGHLGLVFAVFFPVAVIIGRRGRAVRYWPFLFGVGLMAVVTVVSQWAIAGDPFANLAVARKVLTSEHATPRPLFYLSLLSYPFRSHGGVLYLAAVGAVYAIVKRHRGALLVFAWVSLMYIILEFGSSSPVAYRPLFKQARYISALFVPGVVLAGFGARVLIGWGRSRIARWVVIGAMAAALAAGSWHTLVRNTGWRAAERERLHRIRDVIVEAGSRGDIVYVTHWLWNTRAAFYLGYANGYTTSGYAPYRAAQVDRINGDSKVRYVQTLTAGEPMAAGLLINDIGLYRLSVGHRQVSVVGVGEIPPLMSDTPPAWASIDTVYVNRMNEVVLLTIPEGATWPGDDPPRGTW